MPLRNQITILCCPVIKCFRPELMVGHLFFVPRRQISDASESSAVSDEPRVPGRHKKRFAFHRTIVLRLLFVTVFNPFCVPAAAAAATAV